MNNHPLVSIGFPLFNGMRYLKGALDALMAQDYPNIEVVISDNASTDGSHELCLEYAKKHPQIRVFRNKENLGALVNFARVRELVNGAYFMWTAHDDLVHPNFVSNAVRALQDHPEAVLAFSKVRFIDQEGNAFAGTPYNTCETGGLDLTGRVRKIVERIDWYAIYGLMRTEDARQLRFYKVFGTDILLLMELSLKGPFIIASEPQFSYRIRRKIAQDDLDSICKPGEAGKSSKPYSSLARNLLQIIGISGLDPSTAVLLKTALLEMFSLNGSQWMSLILSEHPELVASIQQHYPKGVHQMLLQGIFASLLLDRTDLPTFEIEHSPEAVPSHKAAPQQTTEGTEHVDFHLKPFSK